MDRSGFWHFASVALVLVFACILIVIGCVVMRATIDEMNKRIATPTPAVTPASSWVGGHQLAGDPGRFELKM